jgi:hypothetical protein
VSRRESTRFGPDPFTSPELNGHRTPGGEFGRAFRRQRWRAVRASAAVLGVLSAAGALYAAPHGLATIRLGGLALAWWATLAAGVLLLLALTLAPRGPGRRPPR